jgi:molecular chaperone GrpE
LDETIREKLLTRFVAYLDGLDHDESGAVPATAEEVREEADLFSVFVELAGLRNEVRTQSRLVKEALDQFRGVFDTLQASHATLEQELKRARAESHDRERTLLKPLLLDIIDVRDRLSAGLKPAVAVSPRWYERLRPRTKREAEEAWQEGMRMTLRRIDRLLADRRIVATETVGRPFDPRLAAAVATIEDPAVADGIVVEEVRPGFLWQGELLRPAEVIVVKRDIRDGDRT